MKTPLQEVVEMLQDAAKAAEVLSSVPEARITVNNKGETSFSVWGNGAYFSAETIGGALNLAFEHNPKKQKLDRAAELRRQADQLEQEANNE